jgi:proline dehydrogenase
MLVHQLEALVSFLAHNWTSCEFILKELVKKGLGVIEYVDINKVKEDVVWIPLKIGERIIIGQPYVA